MIGTPSLRAPAKQSMPQQETKSGLLRRFGSLAQTLRVCRRQRRGDTTPHSRGAMHPSFAGTNRPEEGAGKAGCWPHPWPACKQKAGGSHHRFSQSSGLPRAMVLTVSFALSPVTGLSCHCRQRNRFRRLDASVGAPGPRDFAVRESAARPRNIAPGTLTSIASRTHVS
jgi:hypothetical protein